MINGKLLVKLNDLHNNSLDEWDYGYIFVDADRFYRFVSEDDVDFGLDTLLEAEFMYLKSNHNKIVELHDSMNTRIVSFKSEDDVLWDKIK